VLGKHLNETTIGENGGSGDLYWQAYRAGVGGGVVNFGRTRSNASQSFG
jgi:hypothetical protein